MSEQRQEPDEARGEARSEAGSEAPAPATGFFGQWFNASKASEVWQSLRSGEVLHQVSEQAHEAWAKYDGEKLKERLDELKHTATGYLEEADRKLEVLENDAVSFVTASGSTLMNKVKDVSIFTSDDEEPQTPEVLFNGGEKVPLSRLDSELYALHTSPETLLAKTDAPAAELDATKNKFLLEHQPDLQQLYDSLVPQKLDDGEFWRRYLALRKALEDNDARRKELIANETEADNDDLDDWGTSGEDAIN